MDPGYRHGNLILDFKVRGSEFRVQLQIGGFRCQILRSRLQILGFIFQVLGLRFQILGSQGLILRFWPQILVFRLQVLGFQPHQGPRVSISLDPILGCRPPM